MPSMAANGDESVPTFCRRSRPPVWRPRPELTQFVSRTATHPGSSWVDHPARRPVQMVLARALLPYHSSRGATVYHHRRDKAVFAISNPSLLQRRINKAKQFPKLPQSLIRELRQQLIPVSEQNVSRFTVVVLVNPMASRHLTDN